MFYGIMEYGAIAGKVYGVDTVDYVSESWILRGNSFVLTPTRTEIVAQAFNQSTSILTDSDSVVTSESWDLTIGFQSLDFEDFQYVVNQRAALATDRHIVSQVITIASTVTIAGLSTPGLNYPCQVTVLNSTSPSQPLVQADASGAPAAGGFELAALGVLGFNAAEVGKTAQLTYELATASSETIGGSTPLTEIGALTFFGKFKGTRGDSQFVIPQANFSSASSTPITINGAIVDYSLSYKAIVPAGWSKPFSLRKV